MFDPICLDIAEHFLTDFPEENVTDDLKNDLAQTIQSAIEDWISDNEAILNAEEEDE
jgi:hypothetical protein